MGAIEKNLHRFPDFPRKQLYLDLNAQLIVDLFAGGGGVSIGMEMAWGRSPDIAVNHNENALSMHRMNHPLTEHYIADVYEVCPREATEGRPVGWLHLSPDCTHHSQASAGQPRDAKIRGLSWVGKRWAGQVRPICISLENVRQILSWGPLIAKRDKATGRVLKRVETITKTKRGKKKVKVSWVVAAKGEQVPLQQQYLMPDPKRVGQNWKRFVKDLEALGYQVEWRIIKASDRGGHTTRERLLMMARCDGQPILWPAASHHKTASDPQKRWKPAHECLDFSHPCPSIFRRVKALAKNTHKRIAKGIDKFVLESDDPFLVPIAGAMAAPTVVTATHHGDDRIQGMNGSFPTVTCANRGELMLSNPVLARMDGDAESGEISEQPPTAVSPILVQTGNSQSNGSLANTPLEPLRTVTTANDHNLGAVVLVQTGYGEREGQEPRALNLRNPLGTAVAGGIKHAVAAATLVGVGGPEYAGKPTDVVGPFGTVMTENHKAVATALMVPADDGSAAAEAPEKLVAAHIATLRNNCAASGAREPITTISAEGQHQGLVAATLVTNTSKHAPSDLKGPVPVISTGNNQYVASAFLSRQFGQSVGSDAAEPVGTITAGGGGKTSIVECKLSSENLAGAIQVADFMIEHGQSERWKVARTRGDTLTVEEKIALVTVVIKGIAYVIVDIGLRMLKPRELFNAQDFPPDYIIDRGHDGRKFTITQQVRMVGNSVDPLMVKDIFAMNAPNLAIKQAA